MNSVQCHAAEIDEHPRNKFLQSKPMLIQQHARQNYVLVRLNFSLK